MPNADLCIGVSQLRTLNGTQLRELVEPLVVFSHSKPVAVLVSYAQYLQWQERLQKAGAAASADAHIGATEAV